MSKHLQDYFTFWRCGACPACGAENWTYDSHSQRHYPDIRNGIKCHNCGNKFFLGEDIDFECRYAFELEEYGLERTLEEYLDYHDGKSSPSS